MDRQADISSKISLRRLQTLTDCFFALCLLLMVVFIEKPQVDLTPTEENILSYLISQQDVIIAYLVTFLNISYYWFFSHNIGQYLRRSDGMHVFLTVNTLVFVGLLPYASALNIAFAESMNARLVYSFVVFLIGLIFCIDWLYATGKDRLVDRSISPVAVERLIVESLVQPIAAVLSFGGAFISNLWWQLPFLSIPAAVFLIHKIWERRRERKALLQANQ